MVTRNAFRKQQQLHTLLQSGVPLRSQLLVRLMDVANASSHLKIWKDYASPGKVNIKTPWYSLMLQGVCLGCSKKSGASQLVAL